MPYVMVAMRHLFLVLHAYFGRFCAKERIMAAGYANFPSLMPDYGRDQRRFVWDV